MALQLFLSAKRRPPDQPLHRRRIGQSFFQIRARHLRFWSHHPALLCSLSLLIGTSSPLFWGHLFWPALWSLYLLFLPPFRSLLQILLVAGSVLYGLYHRPPDTFPNETKALFSPSSLSPHQTPFQKGLIYKGTLSLAQGSVPCSIYYRSEKGLRPPADRNYLLEGKLQPRGAADFLFKPTRWEPIDGSWSLAELRYRTKERFRNLLQQHLASPRTASFLSSLTTGDVDDRLLRYEFGRLGLQHILAISGFHFGILIAFCSFSLGLFLPRRWKIGSLFLAVNLYFLFVGSSPAVQRSWLTALFYLCGQFLNRPTSGLNLLGCALGAELLFNPLVSSNLGFQLSFLSCAGIFLFHPFFDAWLQPLFPKRSKTDLRRLQLPAHHIVLLSSFFRQAIALTLSVNLVLLPLLLFHFHSFPLLSLLYNLFFPFFVGFALFALLLSLIFQLLFPPLATVFFAATDFLTAQLLDLATYPPPILDARVECAFLSPWAVAFFLFTLFLFKISFAPAIDE